MHTDTASTAVITGTSSGEMARLIDKHVKSGVVAAFPCTLVHPFLGHLPERLANALGE
ncbi:hypothetical protein [Pseudomonas tumuqii]|uniref:hypothetical protein n=1 Tax=Pseudomonas tumuqii TaxID=2715755 RepID=UPI001553DCFE|nr:hypothetical protein [Pseudomonas tumuqii]